MSTPTLVDQFYRLIWNGGERAAVAELLADDFSSRKKGVAGEKGVGSAL